VRDGLGSDRRRRQHRGGAAGAARDGAASIEPCAGLTVDAGVDVGGYQSDRYTWHDARCEPRSAALVHNDVRDPSGHFGGLARELTYRVGDDVRTCTGSVDDHPEFGEVVNHFADTASVSTNFAGTHRTLLAGPITPCTSTAGVTPSTGTT